MSPRPPKPVAAERHGPGLRERLAARGPAIASVAFGIAIVADAAREVRHLAQQPARPPAAAVRAGDTDTSLARLSGVPLFGTDAPATALPSVEAALVLIGTVALPDARRGLAIVGPTALQARLYGVGGQVPGEYTLRAVYADHVELERDGVLRSLFLPRADLGRLLGSTETVAVADVEPPAEVLRREAEVQKDPLYLMSAGQWTFGGFNPRPKIVGGRVVGALLTPRGGDAAALARKVGLRAGDVLTEVDGQPLGNASQLPAQLRALEGRQVQLTVQRPGGEAAVLVVSVPTVEHDDG